MNHTRAALPLLAVALVLVPTVAHDGGEESIRAPFFTEVTTAVGLSGIPGFRLSVADVNNDGYPDILLHRALDHTGGDVLDKQYLYLNLQGDPPGDPTARTFVDFTVESGIRADRAGLGTGRHSDSGIFADVDNDGDLDLFTLTYLHRNYTLNLGTNDLLLNDGAGHFTLAPSSPFHLEPIPNSAAAVFLDYDLDGNVDLFVGNWYFNDLLTTDRLYRGHGDGSFTNVTAAAGIDAVTTCIYGVAAWDWNGDGFTDLFAPSYSHTVSGSTPVHWENNGDGTFTAVQGTSGYGDWRGYGSGIASFGSMPRDYDNDGDIDFLEIMTHGYGDGADGVHTTTVTHDAGDYLWDFFRVDGRDTEDPDTAHHGDHYASWLDFDNDGLSDFALTESGYDNNRFYLFRQQPGNTFFPFTASSGMNSINIADLPPHNVIPLDFDRDGDQDLLVGFGNDTDGIQLWRNDLGTLRNWLVVELDGGGGSGEANRAAIGARVEVTTGATIQTRVVRAGDGHHGPQAPLSLHFGLDTAAVVDTVRVHWPDSSKSMTELIDVDVNQFLRVEQVCRLAVDPANLHGALDGADVVLSWDDPADPGVTWNLYRDTSPDPALWGGPHAAGVVDADPGTPGIQFRDSGAVAVGQLLCYLVTAVNECGETPLR